MKQVIASERLQSKLPEQVDSSDEKDLATQFSRIIGERVEVQVDESGDAHVLEFVRD